MEVSFLFQPTSLSSSYEKPLGYSNCGLSTMRQRSVFSRAGVAALVSSVVFATASIAAPIRSELCQVSPACVRDGLICILVQVPSAQQDEVSNSDAFEDMESQIEGLQAQRKDVRYVVTHKDLADVLGGLSNKNQVRTVFLGRDGMALLVDGLFVDDPAPVEYFFDKGKLPESARGAISILTLTLRSESCAKASSKH